MLMPCKYARHICGASFFPIGTFRAIPFVIPPLSIEDKAEGSDCSNALTTLLRNTPSLRAERYSVKPHTGQDPFTNLPPMP